MTQPDLWGTEAPPIELVPAERLSADQKRTLRQRAAVAAGIHPLTRTKTRPDLGTCGDCEFRIHLGYKARTFPKCTVGADPEAGKAGPYMTHGAATDCRAWWPACDQFRRA